MLYRVVRLKRPNGKEIETELFPCNRFQQRSHTTRETCLEYIRGLLRPVPLPGAAEKRRVLPAHVDMVDEQGRFVSWEI